jgi:hypothetical protein
MDPKRIAKLITEDPDILCEDEPCPACGQQAYVGFSNIECPNQDCKYYSEKQEEIVKRGENVQSDVPGNVLDRRIEDLGLGVRARNCLGKVGIETVGELIKKTSGELASIRNMGRTSIQDIKQALGELGLSLAVDPILLQNARDHLTQYPLVYGKIPNLRRYPPFNFDLNQYDVDGLQYVNDLIDNHHKANNYLHVMLRSAHLDRITRGHPAKDILLDVKCPLCNKIKEIALGDVRFAHICNSEACKDAWDQARREEKRQGTP